MGDEIVGKLVERFIDYDSKTREPRGYKYHLDLRSGRPAMLYGTGLLDHLMLDYKAGDELIIVYQGRSAMISGEREGTIAHQWRISFAGAGEE